MTINIAGVEVDLKKIGIDFIPNEEQMAALEHLANFMKSDALTTALSGGAGVGKTSIVKIFLEYVKRTTKNNVRLVAPTHKAKAILSRLSDNDNATTLHSLLGLRPNFNLLDFDARDMKFLDSLNIKLFETPKDLIVVDEYSMISDEFYDMLVRKMDGRGKILFLGDNKQLKPVKQNTISKIATSTDFPGFMLTKVERQRDNPLLDTLVKLREGINVDFKSDTKDGKGLLVYGSRDFQLALSENYFSLENLSMNPNNSKILAYTNARVSAFNGFARKLMGAAKNPLNKGELLMAHDSFSNNYEEILFNGSEYIVMNVKKGARIIPSFGKFPGYLLTVMDIYNYVEYEVFLLDPEASDELYTHLGIVIEETRLKAVKRKYLWQKNYFPIMESFITMRDICYDNRVIRKKTVDYGYACTAHKSQGSTYKHVFVDVNNLKQCRDEELRKQLEYVSLSRATHYAHILKS